MYHFSDKTDYTYSLFGRNITFREESRKNTNDSQSTTNSDGGMVPKILPSSLYPSYRPSTARNYPSTRPSSMPSTSFPTTFPSAGPSTSPSFSMQPSSPPSKFPSSSPTTTPGCPEKLLNFATLDADNLLTLKYEVVIYQGNMESLGGGLLCISLEYAGTAGWMGVAFSEATRNPQFGRKEAVIGIVGIQTTSAMSTDNSTSLGQQNVALENGPQFVNPGKYEIPAGGIGNDAYYGPGLKLLRDIDGQTLIDGTISMVDPYANLVSDQSKKSTVLSFAKYLREPGEIEINPYVSTLLMYVVAPLDGNNYDGNPEWKSTYLNFLQSSSRVKSGPVRKRTRQHSPGEINRI